MISLQLALKNVYRKRERSFLTIIGVLLAVGSFISLLSVAEGMYSRVSREVNGRYVDIYILPSDAAALPTGPVGTIGYSSEILSPDIISKLKKFDFISQMAPIYRVQQKIGNETIIIWGINYDKFRDFFPFLKLQPGGRMYSGDTNEIIIGGLLAQAKGIQLQTPIVIEGQAFDTVGIGVSNDSFQDYFCYIPLEASMKLKRARGYQEIWLQLKGHGKKERETAAIALRKAFPDLNIKTREEYLGAANEYIKLAWLLQFAISSIGVLIAMTASMNTMLMSTYERMKEFGTLRAIGASRFSVFLMILAESLILTFIGGIGGIILGVMGSRVLDEAVKALMQISFPLAKITPVLIIDAIILSLVVGVIGAIIPAIIVYRMNIIDAMRWE